MKLSPRPSNLFWFLVAVATVAGIGIAISPVPIPWDVSLLATGIMLMAGWPMYRWIRRGNATIPMFEVICLSYGMHYGFGVFSQENYILIHSKWIEIPWEYVRQAQALALLGAACLIVGYGLGRRRPFSLLVPAIQLPFEGRRRMHLAVVCVVLSGFGLLASAFEIPPLGGPFMLLHEVSVRLRQAGGVLILLLALAHLAVALLTIELYQDPLPPGFRGQRLLLFGYIMVLFVIGLRTTMIEAAFVPLLVHVCVRVGRTRDVPVGLVCVLVLALAVLNTAKHIVREQQADGWVEAVQESKSREVDASGFVEPPTWRRLLQRVSLVNRSAWVCFSTPEEVPFLGGTSYAYGIYIPIPRVLWRDKPAISEATRLLDDTYNLRSPGGEESIGIGIVAEAFANFSWRGVIALLLVQGAFVGAISLLLNRPGGDGGAALFTVLMVGMINGIGTSTVMIYGGMVQMIIVCVLLMLPFARKFRNRQPAARPEVAGPPLSH